MSITGTLRHLRRAILGALAIVVLTLALAAPALADHRGHPHPGAPYPPPRGDVACDRNRAAPGTIFFCEGSGFRPNSTVVIEVAGPGWTETLTTQADRHGRARIRFQVPPDSAEGPVQVTFTGTDPSGQPRVMSVQLMVVRDDTSGPPGGGGEPPAGAPNAPGAAPQAPAAGAQEGGGGLPATGTGVTRGVAAAGMALAVGIAALALSRRRRAAASEHDPSG